MSAAHGEPRAYGDEGEPPVVVRDKRRIDPESGAVRPGTSPAAPAAAPPVQSPEADELRRQLGERTADLQRLKAEYDNYRRRVERDRAQASDQATAKVLGALLPTLDDIARARDHGDVDGPFKAVADSFEAALDVVGLERFGRPGEAFDPMVHDALVHQHRADVTGPTCVEVYRAGYRFAGRVLRPAQVVVADRPADEVPEPAADVIDLADAEIVDTDAVDTGMVDTDVVDIEVGDADTHAR